MTPPGATGTGASAEVLSPPAVFARLEVLKNRPEFLRAARARRHAMPGFILQARRRDPAEADPDLIRIGYTCSKKVGNAVARNRAKRRLREVARLVLPERGQPGWDYVLIGRKQATATRVFDQMLSDLRDALGRVHGK